MSFLQLEKVQAQAEKEKGSIQKEHDNNMYIIVIIIITIIITICCHHRSPLVLSQSLRYGLTQLLELLGKMLTSDRSTNEDASAWYNNNTTIIIMIINMYNNDKNNNNNNKTMMLLFQRCYLEDRVWMSHLFWGNNCLSQQKLMFVWKFSNWPLTFLWILKGLVILGILEMPCSKYSNFPKKTKYGLCSRRWSLQWGSGNVLTATPSALDAGWDWRSESESRWQSQIDNYNDNDLHNILSGTSSRAKDAPPAQGLFWFVASI